MEILALIGGLLYVAALGFRLTGGLGRFLDGGGLLPYWDEADEKSQAACAEAVNMEQKRAG